jgi:GNAT superfamily N-acetyltransferase
VRDATPADIEGIARIAAAAWRDTYKGLLAPATIEAFIAGAYSAERLARRVARDEFLVGLADGVVVAFADAFVDDDRLTLAAIYVDPPRRGAGTGTLLLEELRRRHPELPVVADVLNGNRKGEVFYERRGFEPRETLEDDLFGERVVERRWWLVDSGGSQPLR